MMGWAVGFLLSITLCAKQEALLSVLAEAEQFLSLSPKDRGDAVGVAADRSGRPSHLFSVTERWS